MSGRGEAPPQDEEDLGASDGGALAPDRPALAAAVAARLAEQLGRRLAPGLYVVATPIGHLADITLRALAVLATADVVYCEDTRHSRALLSAYAIARRLRPYHEHNAETERPRVLAELAQGRSVALISDAGTPLVSDPGYKLVRAALDGGFRVTAVPGASALTAALSASGVPTDRFLFVGFLPARQAARREAISELAVAAADTTLVLFESPGRLAECLADLAEGLGQRPAVVARELTKLHEELLRGALPELAQSAQTRTFKGECVILVAPRPAQEAAAVSDADIISRLTEAMATATLRDAARAVADALAVPRKRVYDLALALKRGAS